MSSNYMTEVRVPSRAAQVWCVNLRVSLFMVVWCSSCRLSEVGVVGEAKGHNSN